MQTLVTSTPYMYVTCILRPLGVSFFAQDGATSISKGLISIS